MPRPWCGAIGITTRAQRARRWSSNPSWRLRARPTAGRGSGRFWTSVLRNTADRVTAFETRSMNLAEQALRPGHDTARANRSAFLTAQGPITNAQFQRQVFAIVKGLLRAGARPGDKVLLRMTNSTEFAAAFLAVVWTGAIPVLQNSQFGRSELDHI